MPLHMVRHSVTRHAKAPGAAEDVVEDAATVAELARAIKAERAKTQRAFERHLRRRVAEVATAKATEADELADEVANIALATVSGGGAGAGPTPPAAPTPFLAPANCDRKRQRRRRCHARCDGHDFSPLARCLRPNHCVALCRLSSPSRILSLALAVAWRRFDRIVRRYRRARVRGVFQAAS